MKSCLLLLWFSAAVVTAQSSPKPPGPDDVNVWLKECDAFAKLQVYSEALRYCLPAAEAGQPRAAVQLGEIYAGRQDYTNAALWYRRAADSGDAVGMNLLGVCYAKGTGVPKDYVEAMTWFRKAAKQNNVSAIGNIANAYENGWGVEKDLNEALRWFTQAEDLGYQGGATKVIRVFDKLFGAPSEDPQPLRLYAKSFENGSPADKAILVHLLDKKDIQVEREAVITRKTCDGGGSTPLTIAEAMELGSKSAGWGSRESDNIAVQCFLFAAQAGDAGAQNDIAFAYEKGLEVKADPAEALRWYEKAAQQNSLLALANLSRLYDNGIAVVPDHVKAQQLRSRVDQLLEEQTKVCSSEALVVTLSALEFKVRNNPLGLVSWVGEDVYKQLPPPQLVGAIAANEARKSFRLELDQTFASDEFVCKALFARNTPLLAPKETATNEQKAYIQMMNVFFKSTPEYVNYFRVKRLADGRYKVVISLLPAERANGVLRYFRLSPPL